MAEKSLADTIIDNYTYTDDWKNENSNYIGNGDWTIPARPKTFTTQFIDIDRYYNHYNIVSPRVEVEFRTGDSDDSWTNLKQLVSDGGFVCEAVLENGVKKEVIQKNDVYTIDGKEVKVGDTVSGSKIVSINKVSSNTNNNNNYFVSATIEDTGYRTLQLELFDRTFTTIQAMLFEAIKHASGQQIEDAEKTSNSKTSFDLEFVKMPALTRNNIRIRYGYNDSVNTVVDKKYWSAVGLDHIGFYQEDGKYRWISREFNDKDKRQGQTNGNDKEIELDDKGNATSVAQQNISTDNALFYLNNQSTILGGFEEFYITNVQSTLTNTGIKYSITAVGSDALKLNGYKFVQKYANIIDKPKNVLASLMRCFNFSGNGSSAKAKDTNQTMIKLVWNDDKPLAAAKKILPTKDGYKAYSADEQKEELDKDKLILAGYKQKLTVAQRLLGCLTSEQGDDYVAGSIIEQKKLYPDWKLTERMATTSKNYNADLFNTSKKSPLWFNCYAQVRGVIPNNWDIAKEAFFAYYLKNYGSSRISVKLDDGYDATTGVRKAVYNCDDTDVSLDGYTYPCTTNSNFFYSRIARAVLADTIADNVYNFNGASIIETINQHYLVKSQQLNKIEAVKEIFRTLQSYIKTNLVKDIGGGQYYIKFPISFIDALNTDAAKKMIRICFQQRSGGARLGNINGDGWTVLRPAENMFDNLPDAVGDGDRYSEDREKWANKLFYNLKEKEIKDEDIEKAIEKIDKTGSPEPQAEYSNMDAASVANLAVAFSYAIGVAGMTGNASDTNNTNVSIDTGAKLTIKLSDKEGDIKSETSKYGYVCFDFAFENETYNVSGKYKGGGEIKFTPNDKDGSVLVRKYLDDITKNEDCDRFMINLNRCSQSFKNAYVLEEQAIEQDTSWTVLSTEEQLNKIKAEIDKFDFSSYKVELKNKSQMDSSFREVDSFNGVRSGKTISKELYDKIAKYAPAGYDKDNSRRELKFEKDDFVNLAKDITLAISKVNDKYNELDKKTRDNESALSNDEITLSLGGPESAVDNTKFYKSISSLLNEFCNACPPYHDYEQEAERKTAYAKGKKQEDVAEYVDADGNKQTLDLKGEAPTYNLTWDIIGKYKDGKGEIPVVGLHYRTPIKPKMIRVYKWGTGNPNMHAVKSVNITTSSEFALLSSAANSTLELGIGGKKVAIKGVNRMSNTTGANEGEIQAEYDNYKSNEEPAYFKNIVSENDKYSITDAAFQSINKGTITLLGDPSLRFGGYINPMTYPIYLDIDLQNEGVTWKENRATKSTMSGVYVVSKITHSINTQGYVTTLEVMRYPGVNEVISV